MLSVYKVADFFIELAQNENEEFMTNLRLQKLLYFAQGWSLARNGRPLFSEPVEAWVYGPVVRSAYQKYAPYRANPIIQAEEELDELSEDDMSLLLDVYRYYGRYTASALVELSHKTQPWADAMQKGQNSEISHEAMRAFFLSQPALPAFDDEVLNMLPIVEGYLSEEGVMIFPKEDNC